MALLYRGGPFVPNLGAGRANSNIPTGLNGLALNKYYSSWGNKTRTFTMNVGTAAGAKKKKKGTLYGFGPGFGSIISGAPVFISPIGQLTLVSFYFNAGNNRWYLTLGSSSAIPATLEPFKAITMTGYNVGGVLSLSTPSTATATTRTWSWSAGTAHPISGTVACSIQYYG